MAINFPTSLDNFTNPSSGNTLDSPSHSLQHSDINDAVEALERKVGLGTAVAGSASAGQVLTISAAGTSTWSTPGVAGLTQIVPTSVSVGSGSGSFDANGAVTFTGASSVAIDGIFTSAYENYRIIVKLTAATATPTETDIRLRLRAGGTTTTTNYTSYRFLQQSTNLSGVNTAEPNIGFAGLTYGKYMRAVLDILSPQTTDVTEYLTRGLSFTEAGSGFNNMYSVLQDSTTQFDGCLLYPATGTISGTFRVYGYKN